MAVRDEWCEIMREERKTKRKSVGKEARDHVINANQANSMYASDASTVLVPENPFLTLSKLSKSDQTCR